MAIGLISGSEHQESHGIMCFSVKACSVLEKNTTRGLKRQPDKVGMSHPSLVIHSWSLCGLITPSAPKSVTRIEVPSEFPKFHPRSQQEPWTWLQNSQAVIAITSFNCLDCGFLSGNMWTSREVLGHPFLMEETKTQRQTWSSLYKIEVGFSKAACLEIDKSPHFLTDITWTF